MLDGFQVDGATILAWVTAAASLILAITGFIRAIKSERRTKREVSSLKGDIVVTREGIVNAFQTAKIPTDLKVDLSNKVDEKFELGLERVVATIKEHEELRTKLMIANTQILAWTAAFNKLSEADKQKINDLIKEMTDKDSTVEV